MTSSIVELLTNLMLVTILILTLLLIALALVNGVYYRNVMKITARIDDINDTLVSYAQKNGGIGASTPGFSYATNIDELKQELIAEHRLSGSVVTPTDISVTQTTESGLRGSLIRVTTNYRIPVFRIKGLVGRSVFQSATPRVAEGIVHQYQK